MQQVGASLMARPIRAHGIGAVLSGIALFCLVRQRTRKRQNAQAGNLGP